MSANLRQLRARLDRGFYVDNLNEMARLCRCLAQEFTNPAPFFVMEQVFKGISKYWEDRSITVEEAKLVENYLKQPLKELVAGPLADASEAQVLKLLNNLITPYMFLFK